MLAISYYIIHHIQFQFLKSSGLLKCSEKSLINLRKYFLKPFQVRQEAISNYLAFHNFQAVKQVDQTCSKNIWHSFTNFWDIISSISSPQ